MLKRHRNAFGIDRQQNRGGPALDVQNAPKQPAVTAYPWKRKTKKPPFRLYYGWHMIGLVSALRILGGGLHNYGFTVFFLPVTKISG